MSESYSLPQLGWSHLFQQQLTLDDLEQGIVARVAAVHRERIVVFTEQGERDALIPGNWRGQRMAQELPTVGDWLLLHQTDDQLIIDRILERKTLLSRKAAGDKIMQQLIAANVDLLLLVTSCNDDFNLSRLERYLVFARDAGCEVLVVVTKADLVEDDSCYRQALAQLPGIADYCILDARRGEAVDPLRRYLRPGMTVSLVGSSGVGKSTLMNSLLGEAQMHTSGIREQDSKGRHTTTARYLWPLDNGICLIDTPGMRELQLGGLVDTSETFEDIQALAEQCRFRDCQHENEPGCAVRAALEAGRVSARRVRSYLKLSAEGQHSEAVMLSAEQRQREKGRRFKKIAQDMHARRKFEKGVGLKG